MPTSNAPKLNLLARSMYLPSGGGLRNRLAKSSMSETLATCDNTMQFQGFCRCGRSGSGCVFGFRRHSNSFGRGRDVHVRTSGTRSTFEHSPKSASDRADIVTDK